MKRNIVIFLFVVVVVSALLIFGRMHRGAPASGGAITEGAFRGKPAPDFTLKTLDGHDLKLSDLRGKAVLLNFWATWCTPCKAEMPWFVDFQRDFGAQGLQVVGVAMDDASKEDIAKFAKEMGVNYPVVLGREKVAEQYGGVQFLPTTFYIDRNGNIDNRVFGIVDRQEAEASVKKILASAATSGAAPVNAAPPNTVPNSAPTSSQGVHP